MAKFRKKPVVIEALEFTGDNADEIILWAHQGMPDAANAVIHRAPLDSLSIRTLEGQMHAARGDWIIRGVKGEFYPCKPDIFAATYESAEDEKPQPDPAGKHPRTALNPAAAWPFPPKEAA